LISGSYELSVRLAQWSFELVSRSRQLCREPLVGIRFDLVGEVELAIAQSRALTFDGFRLGNVSRFEREGFSSW
jgi:hypothetical protein